jgi:hypothetical protein
MSAFGYRFKMFVCTQLAPSWQVCQVGESRTTSRGVPRSASKSRWNWLTLESVSSLAEPRRDSWLPQATAARSTPIIKVPKITRTLLSVGMCYETDVVTKSAPKGPGSPSEAIDARIRELGDWRGETLSRLRMLIKQADPDVVEEWKWVKPTSGGTAVWSHHGGICTGEVYKTVVKLTFFKGASLADPSGLFNSSLEGKVRRAIDVHEGEEIDEKALTALVRSAVALNTSSRA